MLPDLECSVANDSRRSRYRAAVNLLLAEIKYGAREIPGLHRLFRLGNRTSKILWVGHLV